MKYKVKLVTEALQSATCKSNGGSDSSLSNPSSQSNLRAVTVIFIIGGAPVEATCSTEPEEPVVEA